MANAVLGIDFGTTNTKAAWVDRQGKLHVVPVTEKRHVLPSVVWFKNRAKFVVGAEALRMIIDDPKNTIHAPKRFMGRAFRSHFARTFWLLAAPGPANGRRDGRPRCAGHRRRPFSRRRRLRSSDACAG